MLRSWLRHLQCALNPELAPRPTPGRKSLAELRSRLGNLLPYVRPHRRTGAIAFSLSLLTALATLPQPLLMRHLIDSGIVAKNVSLLWTTLLALFLLKAFERIGSSIETYQFACFEQGVLTDVQQALFGRALRFPKTFFDENHVGYLMSRLSSDVMSLRWFFSNTIADLLANTLRLVGGMTIVTYLNWKLAIVALLSIPMMAAAIRFFSPRLRALSKQGMEQRAHVASKLQEALSAATLVKAFASEGRTEAQLSHRLGGARRLALAQSALNATAGTAIHAMPELTRALSLALGAYWVIQGQWTIGALVAFLAALEYVYGPARSLARANLALQDTLASLERVSALFDIVPEHNFNGLRVQHLRGEVSLDHVCFAYNGGTPVLHDLCVEVRAGEHLAIVGPSGAGKTTLINLLLGFYNPTSGNVRFDGRPLGEYELSSLRARIGYVSQSSLLLSGTIRDNLAYGDPTATPETLERAARLAGIHDHIAALPRGYDSEVGERGVNFSEGQKQRLAIARALVKDPDILVLDEPSSALDHAVERSIFEELPRAVRHKTLFVITHRASTLHAMDRVLVLEDPPRCATHAQLLETSAFYRGLMQAQTQEALPTPVLSPAWT